MKEQECNFVYRLQYCSSEELQNKWLEDYYREKLISNERVKVLVLISVHWNSWPFLALTVYEVNSETFFFM